MKHAKRHAKNTYFLPSAEKNFCDTWRQLEETYAERVQAQVIDRYGDGRTCPATAGGISRLCLAIAEGHHATAIVLEQCIFWSLPNDDGTSKIGIVGHDGRRWWYQSDEEWRIFSGITDRQLRTARKHSQETPCRP
jgi:hypothetical protein